MRTRVIVPAVLAAVCLGAGGGCSSPDVRMAAAAADGLVYRPEIQPLGWSADGRRVRFVHAELYGGYDHADFRCGGSGVYETDGGSPPRAVTAGQSWCQHAAGWLIRFSSSADGRTVYQLPDSGFGDCSAIQAFDLPGARWRQAARLCGSHVFAPAISPDGRRIAVGLGCGQSYGGGEPPHITPRGCVDRDGDRITVMNVDGSEPRIVGEPRDRHPVWSPDGRSLAVMTEGEWNIAVIDLETGARRVVTQGEHPAWSPDGEWLAFTRFPKDQGGRGTLRVIRVDGTGEHTVFQQDREDMRQGPRYPSPGGSPRHPLWSPDGRRIVFTKHFQSGNTLWIVNADGTGLRRLSDRIEPAG